jgi:hypothetical protein
MLRGKLKFDTTESVPSGQRITVTVVDTARLGVDAIPVAEKTLTIPEDFDTALSDLPFEIDLDDLRDHLTLRAHMPRHDGNDVQEGDMVTTASIPVREDGEISVILHKV